MCAHHGCVVGAGLAGDSWRVCLQAYLSVCMCTLCGMESETRGYQVGVHYSAMDQSSNQYVKQYGAMHLEMMPRNAILIVKGDVITNSIRYLQVRSLPT